MFHRAALLAGLIGVSMASSASAQVKLEYKFPEGLSTNTKATLKYTQTLTIGDANVETVAEIEDSASQSVGKRGADGALPVSQKTNSIRVHITAAGQEFDLDSNDPNAKFDIPELQSAAKQLGAVAGSEYTLLLNDKNEIKAIQGVDKILEKVKDDQKAFDELKARLSEEKIKKEFETEHNNLPKVLAAKGDTWEATETEDIGSGQTLTFRRRYEYLGTKEKDGRTLDEFGVKALEVTYGSDPNSTAQLTVVKSDLKVEASKGTVLFDRESGYVVDRQTEDRLKGDMTIKINGMELPSKLDLTVDRKINTAPEKKDK